MAYTTSVTSALVTPHMTKSEMDGLSIWRHLMKEQLYIWDRRTIGVSSGGAYKDATTLHSGVKPRVHISPRDCAGCQSHRHLLPGAEYSAQTGLNGKVFCAREIP